MPLAVGPRLQHSALVIALNAICAAGHACNMGTAENLGAGDPAANRTYYLPARHSPRLCGRPALQARAWRRGACVLHKAKPAAAATLVAHYGRACDAAGALEHLLQRALVHLPSVCHGFIMACQAPRHAFSNAPAVRLNNAQRVRQLSFGSLSCTTGPHASLQLALQCSTEPTIYAARALLAYTAQLGTCQEQPTCVICKTSRPCEQGIRRGVPQAPGSSRRRCKTCRPEEQHAP